MQKYINPPKQDWEGLLQRPPVDVSGLFDSVATVLDDIAREGDTAIVRYSEKFDG
jgi:histidinol dehydrogenase